MRTLFASFCVLPFLVACGTAPNGEGEGVSRATVTCGMFSINGGAASHLCFEQVAGQAVYQGDIVLGNVDEFFLAEDAHRALISNANYMAQRRWVRGVMPYTIDPALPNPSRVQAAIDHYRERTGIRLVPRTSEPDFVTFRPQSTGACSSHVGRIGGQQFVSLEPGCGTPETIHEIAHALGMWHEQGRADRDANINIVWANINSAYAYNFNQDPANTQDWGPYDFFSIMHYNPRAFSTNGQPTITRKDGSLNLGPQAGLSNGDIAALAALYPDAGSSPQTPLRLSGVVHVVVAGPASGIGPIRAWNADNGQDVGSVDPFPGFAGGVSVAVGDTNGDGVLDIVAGAGAGGGPRVVVFSGVDGRVLRDFFPYESGFRGGVFVAAGDVNGDGADDMVTGTGVGGGPRVTVFDGRSNARIGDFFAYEASFRGGVLVAVGDVNGDRRAEIFFGTGPGGGPRVRILDSALNTLGDFFAYESSFRGGVKIGSGDVDGDGLQDVLTGTGPGGGPRVTAFRGSTPGQKLADFFAGDGNSRAGVNVAGTRWGGRQAIVTGAGPGGPALVQIYAPNGSLQWQAGLNVGASGANVAGR